MGLGLLLRIGQEVKGHAYVILPSRGWAWLFNRVLQNLTLPFLGEHGAP